MTIENLTPVTWNDHDATPTEPHRPERIPIGEARLLDPAAGAQWAQLRDGRLLRVLRERLPMEDENPWRPDRVALVRQERVTDERFGLAGGGHRTTIREHLVEAQVVGEAAYAAAQARDRAKARRQEAKARLAPYDALERFGFLRGIRTAAGVVSAFRGEHIDLVAVAGRLVPVPLRGGAVTFAHAEASAAVEPLVLPYKETSQEPACDCPHKGQAPEAVGLIGAGVLACAGHLSGELELVA